MRKISILFCCVWLLGCTKVKEDTNLPVLNNLKAGGSSIRLVTFAGPNQVNAIINGFNYNLTPNLVPYTANQCVPGGVSIQNFGPVPVTIPDKVLDQGGAAHIELITQTAVAGAAKGGPVFTQSTVLQDNAGNPTDYYIYPQSQAFGDPNYTIVAVPRSTTPPAGVSNIKIRVVNFGSPVDTFHLTGPVTLTYADASPVNTVLSKVPQGIVTDYVEIPYGTYRFRLFNQAGLELPETLLPAPYYAPSQTGYSPSSIHSFQPGGVYTIFINSNALYQVGAGCGPPGTPPANMESGNGFTIVPDVTPPANISFGKVQFVSTIPGKTCTLSLDNYTVGSGIGYRHTSDYKAVPLGSYSMTLQDDLGQTIAQQNISINPNDNLTVWAYDKNGSPALAVSDNDLTNPNLGQKLRFMNFSQNVPYITFTLGGQVLQETNPSNVNCCGTPQYYYPDINDTTSGASASENLAIGVPATHVPFTQFSPPLTSGQLPFELSVYHSDAGPPPFVPGVVMIAVKPLDQSDFMFSPSTYPAGSQIFTYGEPGVFTVALTGTIDTTISGHPRPDTLLIVKHFK